MLFHENRMSDYFNLAISTRSTMNTIERFAFNRNIISAKEGLADTISTALEGLDSEERIKVFTKSAEKYLNVLSEAIRKHTDSFKKQVALIKETLIPLYKVNMIFEQLYGRDTVENILKETPILYFPNAHVEFNGGKEGSLQMFIVETLCADAVKPTENIRNDLVKYLECNVGLDGQIEYPEFIAITRPWNKLSTFYELGYTTDYILHGFDKLINSGEHVKLSTSLGGLIGSVETIRRDVMNSISKVKSMSADLPEQVKNIEGKIITLQTYAVLFGSLMVILQAVAYSAYEAAYKVHVAEIEFNKTQTK